MREPRRFRAPAGALPPGLVPKAAHGQCFLTNPEILQRSCDYAELSAADTVLEIGPGLGALTGVLARRAGKVIAIEIDRELEPHLAPLLARHANVELHWGDALELAWPACDKLVANLPYGPALPLLWKALEHDIGTSVVVVQERLARRLAAKPGLPGYSRLAVTMQRVASPRVLEVIKPYQFSPPPEVDSAMLRLRRTRPRFQVPDEDDFRRLLDGLFLRRERPLGEALAALSPEAARVAAVLPPDLAGRPVAQTTPEAFGRLAELVHGAGLVLPEISNEQKRTAQKWANLEP